MLTDSQTEVSVDRWPSLDASGLLPCMQFTDTALHWERIGLSANPLILIGPMALADVQDTVVQ